MFQRLRRSFRRKKASYCINCGHVSKDCYHQEYENVFFGGSENGTQRADELKWLDLDYAKQQQQQQLKRCDGHNKGTNLGRAEDIEIVNNNTKNTYIRRDRGHLKNDNIAYRNSTHIPIYNNYVPFPTPIAKRSNKVWHHVLLSLKSTINFFSPVFVVITINSYIYKCIYLYIFLLDTTLLFTITSIFIFRSPAMWL